MSPTPRRSVVLKLSGEAFASSERTLDPAMFESVAGEILQLVRADWRVGVVVGGGNIHRGGRPWGIHGLPSWSDDEIGMYATAINALSLAHQLRQLDGQVNVSAIAKAGPVRKLFSPWRASALRGDAGHDVLIVAGGTGVGGVSTDVAAPMLAHDLGAELLVVSKFGVNGIYSADPKLFPDEARLLTNITVQEAMDRDLRFMDLAAMRLCQQFRLSVHVVPASDPNALTQVVLAGRSVGSVMLPTPTPHAQRTARTFSVA